MLYIYLLEIFCVLRKYFDVFEQSRTVVAEDLPENSSIGSIQELFGKVGKVKSVRICPPEVANGAISSSAKHPKTDILISNKVRNK